MFVTEDPYGTNTTSLYVYFTTDDSVSVSYTVHADGYADFTRDAYQQSQYSKTHEFQILGLIPGEKNTITITLTNADGKSVRIPSSTGALPCLAMRKCSWSRPL